MSSVKSKEPTNVPPSIGTGSLANASKTTNTAKVPSKEYNNSHITKRFKLKLYFGTIIKLWVEQMEDRNKARDTISNTTMATTKILIRWNLMLVITSSWRATVADSGPKKGRMFYYNTKKKGMQTWKKPDGFILNYYFTAPVSMKRTRLKNIIAVADSSIRLMSCSFGCKETESISTFHTVIIG